MNKALPLLFLIGCSSHEIAPYRVSKKTYIAVSESPCVDGTLVNIDQAGCESLYWGPVPNSPILKIRCTYAPKDNVWTRSSFYAVPHNHQVEYSNWFLFCEDRYVKMYSAPYGIKLDND
jgi:hypothetical protein